VLSCLTGNFSSALDQARFTCLRATDVQDTLDWPSHHTGLAPEPWPPANGGQGGTRRCHAPISDAPKKHRPGGFSARKRHLLPQTVWTGNISHTFYPATAPQAASNTPHGPCSQMSHPS